MKKKTILSEPEINFEHIDSTENMQHPPKKKSGPKKPRLKKNTMDADIDEQLDHEIEESFPASDPPSQSQPHQEKDKK